MVGNIITHPGIARESSHPIQYKWTETVFDCNKQNHLSSFQKFPDSTTQPLNPNP